jgi:16S rRNA (cytosine967-C5)-methyltransferase
VAAGSGDAVVPRVAVSPARACALEVVRRVFEQGAYADRALSAEAAGLDQRDRALATQIAYGTVQRRDTLDHVASQLVRRPLRTLEPVVLAAIRIGLFQILYMDRIPDHAAVDETVELTKRHSRAGTGFVNAVLRRGAQRGPRLLEKLSDHDPASAALMHSVPLWLAEMWWQELGDQQACSLLRVVNEPAESAMRINSLIASDVDQVTAKLPVAWRPAPGLPEGVVLEDPFDVHGSELWQQGAVMAQSRGSMLVSRVLAPGPDQRVLDLCAAPGGKTTHMAALMRDRGEILAIERHPGRAAALEETCRRMRAEIVRVQARDAADIGLDGAFDRVLLDPPCSGLGTLQSRPDRRWRASLKSIDELAALQQRLLRAAAVATAPRGALVYSVCTISRREGEDVISRFLDAHRDWGAEDLGEEHPQWRYGRDGRYLQLLPDRDGTDGFFIARLRRGPEGQPLPSTP